MVISARAVRRRVHLRHYLEVVGTLSKEEKDELEERDLVEFVNRSASI